MKNRTTASFILFLFPLLLMGQIKDKELNIVYPPMEATLPFDRNEPFMFIWTDSLMEHTPYSFRIVAVEEYQKPEEALDKNKPVFETSGIGNYYFYYPWQAPGLKDKQQYAWEIRSQKSGLRRYGAFRIDVNIIATTVPLLRFENQYTALKEEPDAGYQMAYDKWLWIYYEEPYQVPPGQGLRFRIYDNRRNLLAETDENGVNTSYNNTPVHPIARKENRLKLNLTALDFKFKEYYYLEVWNEKKETHFLRFRYGLTMPTYQLAPVNIPKEEPVSP